MKTNTREAESSVENWPPLRFASWLAIRRSALRPSMPAENWLIAVVFGALVGMLVSLPHEAARAAIAGQGESSDHDRDDAAGRRAPVTLDGQVLLEVRGLPAYPAEERAQAIRRRIEGIGADSSVGRECLRVLDTEDRTRIVAGDRLVAAFFDADGTAGVSRQLLTERALIKISPAIAAYRNARNPRVLLISTVYALAATGLFALAL